MNPEFFNKKKDDFIEKSVAATISSGTTIQGIVEAIEGDVMTMRANKPTLNLGQEKVEEYNFYVDIDDISILKFM